MANIFQVGQPIFDGVSTDEITASASAHLQDFSLAYGLAASNTFIDYFNNSPGKGSIIDVRYPEVPDVAELIGTPAAGPEDIEEKTFQLAIEKHFVVRHILKPREFKFNLHDIEQFIIAPAMTALGSILNGYVMEKAALVPTFSGIVGTPITTLTQLEPHVTALDNNFAPGRRYGIFVPSIYNRMALSDDFAHVDKTGQTKAREFAQLATVADLTPFKDQAAGKNLKSDQRHTAGLYGNATVDGAVAAGVAVMNMTGGVATTGTIVPGDLFIVTGVEGTYVFTNTQTADGTGDITGATFSPVAPVGGFPDTNVVTIQPDHTKNLIAAQGGIIASAVPPVLTPGMSGGSIQDESGFSVTWQYHPKTVDTMSSHLSFEVFAAAVLARQEYCSIHVSSF